MVFLKCTRLVFLLVCTLSAVAAESGRAMIASVTGLASVKGNENPYDIVLVTIDTLRADRVGVYGYSRAGTPCMDRLASQGVLFENAVAQVPLTPPSHASILTGTYPTVHNVRDMGGFRLDPSHETLAEILRERGWETAAFIGSGVLDRVFGMAQGFDLYDDNIPVPKSDGRVREFAFGTSRRAGEVVNLALNWISHRSGRKPYFLWVHLFDPHAPYIPPSPFRESFKSPYDGDVAYADQELGRLLEGVKRKNTGRPSLTIVLSDHGEGLGDHGENHHGVFLYDSTLRIPWIMAGPGIPRGRRIQQQARTIDLLPTVLEVLGVAIPQRCQGVSLLPAFSGKRTGSTYSYGETLFPRINFGSAELRAIRSNKWKYIRAPRSELYDLEADPGENVNVYEQQPVFARRMENQLKQVTAEGVEVGPEEISMKGVDAETLARLQSLGYVSVGTSRTLELTGKGIDPKDRVGILRLLDRAATEVKQPSEELIRKLEEALLEDPDNSVLFYLLGEAYEGTGKDEDALRLYERATLQAVPGSSKIYVRMANILGRQERYEESTGALERAVELDPADSANVNRLAVIYLLSGRNEEARSILDRLLAFDEGDAQAHNSLGWLALQRDKRVEALQEFQRALVIDPGLLEVYVNLGLLYKKYGDKAKAREAFETFLAKAANADMRKYQGSVSRVERELSELQ